MTVLSHTKVDKVSGKTLEALLLGGASGNVTVRTTKQILFSYTVTSAPASIEEGNDDGGCYRVTRQQHTMSWTAKLHIIEEKISHTLVRKIFHALGSGIETIGAGATLIAVIIFVIGLIADSSLIGLPAGLSLNAVGAAGATIFGCIWALGGLIKNSTEAEASINVYDKEESGSKMCESATVDQIECEGTMTAITVPTPPQTKEQAIDDCVMALIASF